MNASRVFFFTVVLTFGGAALNPAACQQPADQLRFPPLPQLDAQQQRGREFAVRRCSGCHTVGPDDGGAEDGPSFRRLARRYGSISLQGRFTEVSEHGFDHMPPIGFTAAEADDLVAYFNTLRGD
jgi:mono/diheme cytochrome c family protein